eukprot:6182022-Pleurochrysis_carterae.AAC.2
MNAKRVAPTFIAMRRPPLLPSTPPTPVAERAVLNECTRGSSDVRTKITSRIPHSTFVAQQCHCSPSRATIILSHACISPPPFGEGCPAMLLPSLDSW